MTFGKDFTQAVEQKQIAQQEAERAKFIVERVRRLLLLLLLLPSPLSLPFPPSSHLSPLLRTNPPPLLPSPPSPARPQSEQERQAAVVRAEGEAEAATIISRALSKAGDGLVQFRRIEASKEIAGTLAAVRFFFPPLSSLLSSSFSPLSEEVELTAIALSTRRAAT